MFLPCLASIDFSWPDLTFSFLSILVEGAPFLLLGAVLSGLVEWLLPPGLIRSFLPRDKTKGVFAGLAAGLVFPICECGAMPVVGRLIRQGIPVSVAATYLFASPLLNPLTLISTYLAFRAQDPWLAVLLRTGLGGLLCLGIGLWVSQQSPENILRPEVLTDPVSADLDSFYRAELPSGGSRRFHLFVSTVIRDFLNVLIFLVIGAGFAAFFTTSLNRSWVEIYAKNLFIGPIIGVVLAQVLCLCSTTDAFVIAAFAPLPFAAKLAFLIAGPIIDLKLYWLYQAVFKRSFVQALWLRVVAGSLILVWLYAWRPT